MSPWPAAVATALAVWAWLPGAPRIPPRAEARPGPALGIAGARWWRAARRRAHGGEPALDVARLAERLAAMLRAGLPAATALRALAELPAGRLDDAAHRAAACAAGMVEAGGTAARGLCLAADTLLPPAGSTTWWPRRRGPSQTAVAAARLRWLATAWEVSASGGASTAPVLTAMADAIRREHAQAATLATAVAAPRATLRVLSAMPVLGIAFGYAVGANPLRVLATAGPGRGCLLLGVLLWAAGHRWSTSLVRAASR